MVMLLVFVTFEFKRPFKCVRAIVGSSIHLVFFHSRFRRELELAMSEMFQGMTGQGGRQPVVAPRTGSDFLFDSAPLYGQIQEPAFLIPDADMSQARLNLGDPSHGSAWCVDLATRVAWPTDMPKELRWGGCSVTSASGPAVHV